MKVELKVKPPPPPPPTDMVITLTPEEVVLLEHTLACGKGHGGCNRKEDVSVFCNKLWDDIQAARHQ